MHTQKALLGHDMIPFSVTPLLKETQITCSHSIARFSSFVKNNAKLHPRL